jgi:restriction endonuclease S subunit
MRDGWVETTLDRVTECSWGNTETTKSKYVESGYLAYSASGADGFLDWFEHDRTAVVLSAIGAQCGKTWFADGQWTSIKNTIWLKSDNLNLLDKYLFYLSNGDQFWQIRGQAQPFISLGDVKKTKVLLPPLLEQKRIVDLISSVDSYIEALQQQLESAKRSRNAVLHELLTAGGDDWVETTLGEAAEVIMGRQLSPSKKLGTRPRPYIRAANIGSWGINLEDIYEMDFTEIEEERFACQVGDTILVEGGNEKSVGCPALITEKESGLCIQNTVIRSRSRNSKALDPNFQYHLLRFMFWRGDFAQLCAGTTIMHLGQKRAEVVPITIPPLGEQLNIVDTISKFDSAVTYSEETLISAKSLRSGLLSELLSGEHLIPSSYDKVMGAA